MRSLNSRRLPVIAGGIVALGFLATPASGQQTGAVQELQRVIESQQQQLETQQKQLKVQHEQLEAQQKQLEAQQQLLEELQSRIESLARGAPQEAATVTAEKAAEAPLSASMPAKGVEDRGLSQADKHDRRSPMSSNVTYFDPTNVINIPGTNTDIGLHGFAEFQIIHDTVGLNNNRFDTATIPVDGGPSQTKFNVNPSQVHLSSTTPIPDGRLNTMISMDFNGQLDRPEPRLRIAYGEYVSGERGIGVLGGQAYGTMLDLRAVPETLDFAGPASLWQLRTPLFRVTRAVAEGMIAEVALESPENANYIGADRLTRWPDLVVAGTWLVNHKYLKHFRFAGLARDLRAEGADGARDSTFGWALTGSTKLDLPFLGARDNLKLTIQYGEGFGTQLKGGPAEGAFNVASSELEAIRVFGSYGGIQHFWSDKFRSNLVYGYVDSDSPDFLSGDTFDNTQYAAIDFIWSPYDTTSFGAEYLWGQREDKDGKNGDSNRFVLSSKFTF